MSTTLKRDANDLSVAHKVWNWAEKQKDGGGDDGNKRPL